MTIDMLRNGMDSLKRGFSCYHEYSATVKDKDQPSLDDYFILKQAVLSTHHGVKILLKYILDKKSEFLIVDEIDNTYKSAYKEKLPKNYQSVFQTSKANKIHTITYEEALNRVMSICDVVYTKRLYPKFCVNGKMQCKTERKLFKAGAATAAAALSTKWQQSVGMSRAEASASVYLDP